MPRRASAIARWLMLGIIGIVRVHAAEPANSDLERKFSQTVRPFLASYCIGCHSGSTPAAQFDLQPYSTVAAVVRDHAHWEHVLERLTANQMPPRAVKQPPAEARKQVIEWIQAMRASEAQKNAGDPGPVLARRLSNAEYNYTIRDLTGVDIRPTREFPVDPANTAGFDNSGESLTMSPALLNKYLQAAREVANHMVLTPDGIIFAPHPMLVETDREKFAIKRIVDFYERQPTDYADYFEAAWRFKYRSALGKPKATLAGIAAEAKLSPKYLPMIWQRTRRDEAIDDRRSRTDREAPRDVALASAAERKTAGAGASNMRRNARFRGQNPEAHGDGVRSAGGQRTESDLATADELEVARICLASPRFRSQRAAHGDRSAARGPRDSEISWTWQGIGVRAAALMQKARAGDPDLIVPAGQRDRYEAAFASLATVFPDVFYVRERGRFFPDDSQDKGRLLSAGYHNVMGYFRDDTPLMELILDDDGKKELDRLWNEFDFIADFTARTWVQYYFNQSGEVQGKGRESGTARPSGQRSQRSADHLRTCETRISRRRKLSDNPDRDGGHSLSLSVGQRHASVGGAHAGGSGAAPSRRASQFRRARLPPAVDGQRNARRFWPSTAACARRAA